MISRHRALLNEDDVAGAQRVLRGLDGDLLRHRVEIASRLCVLKRCGKVRERAAAVDIRLRRGIDCEWKVAFAVASEALAVLTALATLV